MAAFNRLVAAATADLKPPLGASGLEEGQRTEIRLILDPTNQVALRPVHGMRLIRIAEAPAVIMRLDDER